MIQIRHILLAILIFAVSTVWVKERWALSALESAVFVCASGVAARAVLGRRPVAAGAPALLLAGMCLGAVLQWIGRWTVVRAETAGAALYWLAAACLAWLGREACVHREERRRFLKTALVAGSIVCLAGIVQLFTSGGRVFWLFPSGYDSEVIGPFVSRNNYASFVELLLPVALVLAFQTRRSSKGYLLVAAALVAGVIAGGSRAGAAIVIAESVVAFLLLRRMGNGASARRWTAFAVLAAAFTSIVGYQYLWRRLSDDRDPYALRREFVESSLAMVRAEPLHGFGFGTWPSAYRPFAIVDTGLAVNHAHNEWLQWAAEGGLPACALMAIAMGFCLRPAWQSVWGLGVAAVFLHSVVDYPFWRLGLSAWIFVLMGALSAYGGERRRLARAAPVELRLPGPLARTLAAAAVPLLAFAVFQSVRLGWADMLYHRATPQSVTRAAELCPDRAEYQQAIAQAIPEEAPRRLARALELNPFLTPARIALASRQETEGDLEGAETTLLEAARHDRQYAPAWALANFYFRANRPRQFWQWARSAARISYGELGPLFDLCFLVTDDARRVLDHAVPPRRLAEREYLAYLIGRGRLGDAREAALRIAANPGDDDREPLLDYADRALAGSALEGPRDVWNALCHRGLIPYPMVRPGVLVNGDLSRPFLRHAFDWRPAAGDCALAARTNLPDPAIELFFSGRQPESCEALEHFVPLTRSARYVLRFQFRTRDLPVRTGLHWSVGWGPDYEFPAAESWTGGEWRFQAAGDLARLVLAYRRNPGISRIEGVLLVRQVQLEPESSEAP